MQLSSFNLSNVGKFSGFNPKGPYLSVKKEKETVCVVLTYSVKGRVKYEVSCRSRATMAQKCTKNA